MGGLSGVNNIMEGPKNTHDNDQGSKETISVSQESSQIKRDVKKRVEELDRLYSEQTLPFGFRFRGDWLEYQPIEKNEQDACPVKVCTRLEVVARTKDSDAMNHGRLIRFWDPDGCKHEWAMPMRLFASDGREYRAELLDRGLIMSSDKGGRSLLGLYIQQSIPEMSLECVSQTGWVGNSFVLHDLTISQSEGRPVVYQCDQLPLVRFSVKGNINDFQRLSGLAIGNELMVFVISLAFAPPLLLPLDMENGGFNLVGPSSIGKTKLLKLGASVWGPPDNVQQWRATSNGLEGVAHSFNDSLLCLDELGQIAPGDLGPTVYMLGNGVAKARAQRTGALRMPKRWRVLYLSSGEIGIIDHINASLQKSKVGQEIRAIDLRVSDRPFGCFDNLHHMKSGADFSLLIAQEASNTYGIAGQLFLENLVKDRENAISVLKHLLVDLKSHFCPVGASGQVCRAFERFALVASAGELATAYGITGWNEGTAANAVMSLFDQWLEARGDLGNREEQQIIEQVQLFFENNASSRFINVQEPDEKVVDGAGYRQKHASGWMFYVYPNVYRKEVCKGFDPKYVTKICMSKGLMIVGRKGEACPTWRAPSEGSKRFYHFTSSVLPQMGGNDE